MTWWRVIGEREGGRSTRLEHRNVHGTPCRATRPRLVPSVLRRWGEPAHDAAELVRESLRIVVAGEAVPVLHDVGPAETDWPQAGGDGRGLPAGERDGERLLAFVADLLLSREGAAALRLPRGNLVLIACVRSPKDSSAP